MARFWVGGTGDWDAATTTHWSASSGGAGGETVPTISDSVTLDASSGGGTVTVTATANMVSLALGAFTGTLNTNGQAINVAGTVTVSGTGTRVLTLGSSLITLSGLGSQWLSATTTNLTFNANTSTIKFIDATGFPNTFSGGGLTYNNLWIARGADTADTTIAGSNTFADFKDDGTAAHTIKFTAGTTQTVATFTVSGTAGNLISINSTTTGTHTLTKSGGGTISRNYLNIQHSIATPASTWYASNSINNQAVVTAGSGWIFNSGGFFLMMM